MQSKKNSILLFLIIFLISCKTEKPDFYYTEGGLRYVYRDIVADGASPENGNVLLVKMKWMTHTDSVFYSSNKAAYNNNDVIKLKEAKTVGGIEEGFRKLKEGDSVSFYLNATRFFNEYVNSSVPVFIDSSKDVRVDIRLVKVQTQKEYQKDRQEWERNKELEESKMIEETLANWEASGDSIIEKNELFIVFDDIVEGERVKFNDIFQLHYSAVFVNGDEFYSTYNNGQPDEFQFGQTGQMVEGLQSAISLMKYGQKAKVLIPSNIGFKGVGSAGNIIPPYTPVIYYLEIVPKNEEVDLFIEK